MKTILSILGIIALLVVIVSPFFFYRYILFSSAETVEDCVKKTERINNVNSDSKYLVFGEKETYQNTDSIWRGKFDSSDMYGEIGEDECYEFKVQGWRIKYFSWYRNIYELNKIEKK